MRDISSLAPAPALSSPLLSPAPGSRPWPQTSAFLQAQLCQPSTIDATDILSLSPGMSPLFSAPPSSRSDLNVEEVLALPDGVQVGIEDGVLQGPR